MHIRLTVQSIARQGVQRSGPLVEYTPAMYMRGWLKQDSELCAKSNSTACNPWLRERARVGRLLTVKGVMTDATEFRLTIPDRRLKSLGRVAGQAWSPVNLSRPLLQSSRLFHVFRPQRLCIRKARSLDGTGHEACLYRR